MADRQHMIDAINHCFALMSVNYSNQFAKAWKTNDDLRAIKMLWFKGLAGFSPETIKLAMESLIKTSEYLPTLSAMIEACGRESALALPDSHSAYLEACRAPSPKALHSWSHPAVYYAGKASDWYFLSSTEEAKAYPVFKRNYDEICKEVMAGKILPEINIPAIEYQIPQRLSRDENMSRMREFRSTLGL